MSYIGAEPTTAAFPFDQFSGDGTTTAFTLTYAPASTTSIIVAISGVVQNPNLYSVVGTTLTFSPAPPSGTSNIAVLYLGLPVIGSSSPGNTAFLSATDLTATASQTVFASAGSYTPGFVQVYRNGARLGNADFTATNGTTITLATAATSGDLVTIEYYTLTSLTNALPLTGGTVTGSTTFNTGVNLAAVSGNVGVGTTSPNGKLHVAGTNGQLRISGSGYVVNPAEMTLGQYTGTLGYLQVPGGATGEIQIWNGGSSGVVAFNTYGIGLGGVSPSSGAGIRFPATQSASSDANTLDDYEEGTFTPSCVCTGQTITLSTAIGTYTKIGNVVRAQIAIIVSTVSGAAGGGTTIQGFPFANGDTTYTAQGAIGYNDGFANTVGGAWMSSTSMLFRLGTRSQSNDVGGFNAGGYIDITVVYKV